MLKRKIPKKYHKKTVEKWAGKSPHPLCRLNELHQLALEKHGKSEDFYHILDDLSALYRNIIQHKTGVATERDILFEHYQKWLDKK